MSDSQRSISGFDAFREEFSWIIARPEEDLDLGLAALLVAGEEYPELDIAEHLGLLDGFAEEILGRSSGETRAPEVARIVSQYLFEEQGFQGNANDYYNPENSYFNRVLDTHSGIPITLSLLFLEVARRVGLRCNGVGMPGHFLVGLEGGEVYLDPFRGGAVMNADDCRRLAEGMFGPRMAWRDSYLEPCTKYEFLFRLLNNLKVVYEHSGTADKGISVIQRMIMVNSQASALYKDLAEMQFQLQQYRAALRSLETYLTADPGAADASQVMDWADSIRVTLNRLN